MSKLNVVCLQFDIVWENKEANHRKVSEMLEAKKPPPGSLLVLPEMFDCGFSMNVSVTAEDNRSLSATFLADTASKYDCWVMAGIVARQGDKGLNQAQIFDRSGYKISSYNKMHLFSPAGENQHFQPGDEVIVVDIAGFKTAPLICYDLRFPELFRQATKQGAEVFVVVANWPAQRVLHWCTLLQARAIENQAFVVAVNRSGSDPQQKYPGRSQIIDPWGRILIDAGEEEKTIQFEIDKEELLKYRRDFPVLKDMK